MTSIEGKELIHAFGLCVELAEQKADNGNPVWGLLIAQHMRELEEELRYLNDNFIP